VPLALMIGTFISLLPALPFYPRLVEGFRHRAWLRWPAVSTLMVIYVLALARAFAMPFQPFIYFRF
jgi:alginate O-acetyltransferase complex protein AlgI